MTINTAYEGKQASANAYTGQLLDNVVCFDPNNPHPSCPADAPEEESTKCGKDVEDASLPVGTPCTSGDLYAVPRDKQGAVMVVTSSKRKETCDAIGMNVAMATSYNKNNLYNAVNTCVGSNGKAWVQGYDGFTAHNYGMLVWGPPAGTDQVRISIPIPIHDEPDQHNPSNVI
ncbi:hypothetical protein BC828DRAFT_382801 [Blastocladiella britannica]|nr:hypothetical protein BC828DRAFT_382801 [Blastocladiella britannica]